MYELVLHYNALMGILGGFAFAVIGLVVRKERASAADRDNLIFADGFQGLTVATLVVVATIVYYVEDPRSVKLLKEQASVMSTLAVLVSLQQIDRFRRSLR